MVLRARRRRALRPRRLQPDKPVRLLRSRSARHGARRHRYPERVVEGEPMRVRSDDNAHVLLDFGDARFARSHGLHDAEVPSPAVELYGTDGVLQMLGDDWAPEGFEQWRNASGTWEVFPESDPTWPWTDGLRHLVECVETGRPTVTRPEHAYLARGDARREALGRGGTSGGDRERVPGARLQLTPHARGRRSGSPTTPARPRAAATVRPPPPHAC